MKESDQNLRSDDDDLGTGEKWYWDEFGEYRRASIDGARNEIAADDMTPPSRGLAGDIIADDKFNETLERQTRMDEFDQTLVDENINDQMEDPALQREAEEDYPKKPRKLRRED